MSKNTPVSPKTVFSNPVHFFAFGFGSGLSPKAPGTMGTIVALLIHYFFLAEASYLTYSLIICISFFIGVYLCGRSSELLGVNDHSGIVWDEFVGFWISIQLAPAGIGWMLAAFVLFRFFDIIKPWPINYIDRMVHSGWGIMIDDVIAGIYSFLCLQLILIPMFDI